MDENIFSMFVAPYIDSVAVVAVFNCVAHLQLRFERPRTTTNIIGMLLANEVRTAVPPQRHSRCHWYSDSG